MDDEFWKPKSDLKQQFSERINSMGGTELAQTCVDSFFKLEVAKLWKPKKVLLGEVSYVIDIGLVLSILGFDNLTDDYRQRINEAIKVGSNLPAALWSEILVATLLKHYGVSVQFVPRGSSKTADLSCFCKDRTPFDVEVTKAEMRSLHVAVRRGIEDFVHALRPGDVDWHVACFVSDASDPKILAAAFDAAAKLIPGQQAEEEGLWSVTAVPLSERDDIVGGKSSELFGPTWWPQGESVFFSNATLLNGKGNPVVILRSLVPKASYMNPVLRKADHGQNTEGRPYIIALDASELPRAHERLPPDIEQNFPIWNHVSGVLIFTPLFYTSSNTKTFRFRLLANPYSDWPMPSQLINLAKDSLQELEFTICSK